MKRTIGLGILLLLLLAGAGLYWLSHTPTKNSVVQQTQSQVDYLILHEPAKALAPFQLTDHLGSPLGNQEVTGKWSLIFLGYTYCPDVCPTTLAMMKSVYAKLNGVAPVQVIFVSADPQRDTPDRLKQYIQYFHSEFIGATAPHADLYPLTRNLGLAYAMYDGKTPESYLVDHSASVVLINPKGQVQATFKPMPSPHGYVPTVRPAQLLSDFTAVTRSVH